VFSSLEVIFRRPGRLLLLCLVLPVVGVAVVYFLVPRTYQSAASLWALQRYVVIGATGPEADLTATPAQTQATAVTELLQSRAFALTVANETDVASTLPASVQSDPQQLNDALYTEISQKVTVAAAGYNLFTITYISRSPEVAQKVVQAVIQNFALQSQNFTKAEAQNLLNAYQAQLTQAQQAEQDAAAKEAQYLQDHPNLTPTTEASDPQYALLHAQTLQAQANVQNIENTIDTINQEIAEQGSGSQYLFQVLDAPKLPTQAKSRTSYELIGGGVGLGVALLACALYILILVRLDRSVRTPSDLKDVTDLPVVMEMPSLSSKSPLLLAPKHAQAS
jgi:uncharacterized protein involved in exopolysaccharide biosynthesis